MRALLGNNHPEMKALYPQLFNSSPSVFSSEFSKMGVWHQFLCRFVTDTACPGGSKRCQGDSHCHKPEKNIFGTIQTAEEEHPVINTLILAWLQKYYSLYFLKRKKINNRECSHLSIHFFLGFTFLGEAWLFTGLELTGILCFLSNCVSSVAGIWGGH